MKDADRDGTYKVALYTLGGATSTQATAGGPPHAFCRGVRSVGSKVVCWQRKPGASIFPHLICAPCLREPFGKLAPRPKRKPKPKRRQMSRGGGNMFLRIGLRVVARPRAARASPGGGANTFTMDIILQLRLLCGKGIHRIL